MRKWLLPFVLSVAVASPAAAQLTVPYTFSFGQVASPTEVNSNFAKFADALNRTGGTMTGTLTAQQITPSASNTYDLGSSLSFFRSGYLKTSVVLGQTGGNYTVTWANPAAARAVSLEDPGGTDVFVWKAATQTLTNKTLTSPALASPAFSGTATGTLTCARCVADAALSTNVPLLNAANAFTGASQTFAVGGTSNVLIDAASNYNIVSLINAAATTNNVGMMGGASGDAASLYLLANSGGSVYLRSGSTDLVTVSPGGVLSVHGFGAHGISGSSTGPQSFNLTNTTAGTDTYVQLGAVRDGALGIYMQAFSSTWITNGINVQSGGTLQADGSGGLSIAADNASGAIRFYSGGTSSSNQRWGINAAGDLTIGASSHIAFSTGTPTCASGCSSPSGTDFVFRFAHGSGTTQDVINFGHSWDSAPVCMLNRNDVGLIATTTTTQVTISWTSSPGAGATVGLFCGSGA